MTNCIGCFVYEAIISTFNFRNIGSKFHLTTLSDTIIIVLSADDR